MFSGKSQLFICFSNLSIIIIIIYYLALISRAGGLYGRILTEVVSTDRGQDSPIQTDLARLIRCLFYGKHKNNLFISCNWFVLTDILLANGNKPNLILSKFARPLYCFFFLISSLALTGVYIFRKMSIILHFTFQLFHSKTLPV